MTKLSCRTRTPIGEDSAEKGGEELDERWRRYSTPSPTGRQAGLRVERGGQESWPGLSLEKQ